MEQLTIVVVILMSALLVWAAIGFVCFWYWPATRGVRDSIREHTIHHYVPEKYLQYANGIVTVHSRRDHHATMNIFRRPVAFYYLGRNGRGGTMNHPRVDRPTYARIDIDGDDFHSWLRDQPLRFRPLDRAICVHNAYTGPAHVTHGVRPRVDRSLR